MDKVFQCPAQSGKEFSTSESDQLLTLVDGHPVASASFSELVKFYGFLSVLRAKYARYLYTWRLYQLRELSIIAVLKNHYEEIPDRSVSKIVTAVPRYSKLANTLLRRRIASLKRKIIVNPYQVTKTANDGQK